MRVFSEVYRVAHTPSRYVSVPTEPAVLSVASLWLNGTLPCSFYGPIACVN